MNIVNKVTLKQLLLNRKRTAVTIIGAVISVSMITAVAALGFSFMDLARRQIIADSGEWHVYYQNVDKAQLQTIKEDSETNTVILSRETGYAALKGSKNKNKPYLFIREYSREGFEKNPIELVSGRFPEKADEIVISEAVVSNAGIGYKTGDELTAEIGRRYKNGDGEDKGALGQDTSLQKDKDKISETLTKETARTYVIVGIIARPKWEPAWSPGYTALSYVDESMLAAGGRANAGVILNKVDGTLFKHAESLAKANGIDKVSFNDTLLRYYGVVKDDRFRKTLINLSAIIIGIIMIGSVSLIYNAFAISVAERSRHLGMLSSIGATKVQKRNSVFFEGLTIAAISIPIGIITGLAGIGITSLFINPLIKNVFEVTESFRIIVVPSSVLIAAAVSSVTIFFSTYLPAAKASRFSAMDAIRQAADLKLTGRTVKTTGLTRRIFGIEGELGLKNLKRNKRRYKATVFSLIISMVLFLGVSVFTMELKKSYTLSQDGVNFDLQVYTGDKSPEQKEILGRMAALDDVEESTQIESLDATTLVSETAIADYLKNKGPAAADGKYPYQVVVNALDDRSLKAYAKETGVDFDRMKNTDNISAIVIDTVKYKDMKEDRFIETKVIKARKGDKLDINFFNSKAEKEVNLAAVEMAALTDKLPMGIVNNADTAYVNIVVSTDALNKIAEADEVAKDFININLLFKSSNPLRLQQSIEAIQDTAGSSRISIYNLYRQRQKEEQMILLLSVFGYGFILLITAICIANIFNTISTSVALRKREFAMLKSVGMTPAGFNRMINYESAFYGLKAILYGLPISFAVMYLIHGVLMNSFEYAFTIPWLNVCITIAAVFAVVGVAMLYASRKVKRENIIEALKREIA